MIYGYARVSTKHQRITRQVSNILEKYPEAAITKEFYTGTTQSRPLWEKLIKRLEAGDTLVFDSVSRMARCSEEGFKDYKMLFERGVHLVFLNEPLINTAVFVATRNNLLHISVETGTAVFAATRNNLLHISVETGNAAVDEFFHGNIELINNFIMALAETQIKSAFDQAEKEVTDLHSRISQGMREAKKNGTHIGLPQGATLTTKKSLHCKAIIKKHSKDFDGTLEDPDVIVLCRCSRNSYYKYKRELKAEAELLP